MTNEETLHRDALCLEWNLGKLIQKCSENENSTLG